jgi:hypothetical protein
MESKAAESKITINFASILYLFAQKSAEQAGLSAEYVEKFSIEAVEFYNEIIQCFSSDAQARSYIYDNKIKQAHSIYKMDTSLFIIIPDQTKLRFNTQTGKELANSLKSTPWLIPQEVSKVGVAVRLLREKLDKRFISSRKYSDKLTSKPAPQYPSEQVLQKFYECERKTAYISRDEALINCEQNHIVYKCSYKSHWHQGTPKSNTWRDKPHEIQLNQWQTVWRRYKGV